MTTAETVNQAAAGSELFVLFRVADSTYALGAAEVLQMESFEGATEVPGAPAFVTGIVSIRGKIVPVVDLRIRFGLPQHTRGFDSRVVVVQHGERTVALLVDSAREVMRVSRSDFKPPPRLVDEAGQGFVQAVAQKDNRMLLLLDFAKIIGEEPIDVG